MIAIISDIHSNYEALKSVLRDIDNQNIKETEHFENICKNLQNLKSNKNKSIKFFED